MTVISVAPTKINRYEDLFREFSWKVINVTRLIFEYSLVKRLQERRWSTRWREQQRVYLRLISLLSRRGR